MPDGSSLPENRTEARIEDCARFMSQVTRHWAALDASGPRAGPVREAISRLEPVIFTQMIVAMDTWAASISAEIPDNTARAKVNSLSERILSAGDADPEEDTPPHLSSIDFVQLWPEVIRELRDRR